MTTLKQNLDVEELKEELSSLRADVASLVQAMKDNVDNSSNPTADDSDSNQWDDLKSKIEQARSQGEEITRELDEEVRKHPIASVAIAFGIGYLASKIIK